MKFLFIDDESGLLLLLKKRMQVNHNNLEIVVAFGMRDGLILHAKQEFNVLVIRVARDDSDTFQILSSIRKATPMLIVVIIHPEEIDRAYRSFADVCIYDQTNLDGLEACLEAQYYRLARLSHMDGSQEIPMIIRDMIIYPKERIVIMRRKEIRLTAIEFDLLYYMARNLDRVLSPSQIYEKVWQSDIAFSSNLSSRISRLRCKIEPNPLLPTYIQTVNRAGYKLSSK